MLGVQMKQLFSIAALALVAGCASTSSAVSFDKLRMTSRQAHHDTVNIVTTFSTLNSFVEGVGGKYVTVNNLVPVGASPETYQPTPQDIAKLADAQLLVENGTGIEVWLQHTIANAGNAKLRTITLSDGLKHIDHNPHLWMDPVLARAYVGKIRDALIAIDPANKVAYERNASAYDAQLAALQRDIAKQIATIPAQQRTMIVFHNAWQYYNERFGIRTVGVIELAPGQEPNPSYIGTLVDLARKYHVRAVFSEPEYSPKIAQTLAKSAGIRTVSDLYDDSISNNPKVHDYISMLHYDTNEIVQALK